MASSCQRSNDRLTSCIEKSQMKSNESKKPGRCSLPTHSSSSRCLLLLDQVYRVDLFGQRCFTRNLLPMVTPVHNGIYGDCRSAHHRSSFQNLASTTGSALSSRSCQEMTVRYRYSCFIHSCFAVAVRDGKWRADYRHRSCERFGPLNIFMAVYVYIIQMSSCRLFFNLRTVVVGP